MGDRGQGGIIMAPFQAENEGSLQLHEAHVQILINLALHAGSASKDSQHMYSFPSYELLLVSRESPSRLMGATTQGLVCLMHLTLTTWGG